MIDRILRWANKARSVRALLLTGTRAGDRYDELSDYDIAVFTSGTFWKDDKWLSAIDKVWVCIPEKIVYKNKSYPTRLVIFDKGVKVDFSFFPAKGKLPDLFGEKFKVLLDKDGILKKLKPSSQKLKKPTEEEFRRLVEEFWFEAYHVAVYRKRGDLWKEKSREEGLKVFILQMLAWNAGAKSNWEKPKAPIEKNVRGWVEPRDWKKVVAGNYIELFRDAALEAANLLGYEYPQSVDKNISEFVKTLSE